MWDLPVSVLPAMVTHEMVTTAVATATVTDSKISRACERAKHRATEKAMSIGRAHAAADGQTQLVVQSVTQIGCQKTELFKIAGRQIYRSSVTVKVQVSGQMTGYGSMYVPTKDSRVQTQRAFNMWTSPLFSLINKA